MGMTTSKLLPLPLALSANGDDIEDANGNGVAALYADERIPATAEYMINATNQYASLVRVLRDEVEAIRTWQSARGVPADVRDGFEISLSKLRTALQTAEKEGE